MKLSVKILSFALAAVLLVGCGEPTFDGSSKESIKESVQEMTAEMTNADKQRFQKAITGIYFLGGMAGAMKNQTEEETMEMISDKLDGKTVEEVYEVVAELRKELGK